MEILCSIADIRKHRWHYPAEKWGLVPTMGALHQGHLSLIKKAKRENDKIAVSIFINPIQFNETDDFNNYPRNLNKDHELLEKEGVDLLWVPTPNVVYPEGYKTFIEIEEITRHLEGAARLGHFRGVATVVAKLLNVVQPHKAYFGQKDAQQAAVIKQMADDLNFPVEIMICPTIREKDGLAMSSRNTNLSSTARAQAPCLYEALKKAQALFNQGIHDAQTLRHVMKKHIHTAALARIDYISVANPVTLKELDVIKKDALLSMAVFFDDVRLIDNIKI